MTAKEEEEELRQIDELHKYGLRAIKLLREMVLASYKHEWKVGRTLDEVAVEAHFFLDGMADGGHEFARVTRRFGDEEE